MTAPTPFRALTFAEICAEADRIEEARHKRREWGRWRLDTSTLELGYEEAPGRHLYRIDLERCNDSAEVLDWIAQLNGKTWTTAEDIGFLVEALDDIFGLQSQFCGRGQNRKLDASKFLRCSYGSAA